MNPRSYLRTSLSLLLQKSREPYKRRASRRRHWLRALEWVAARPVPGGWKHAAPAVESILTSLLVAKNILDLNFF
jgi:hypothetical protein